MTSDVALRTAIDLLNVPSRVRVMTRAPLPEGTALVLGIAAGDAVAEQEAAGLIERPPAQLRQAAGFFIEQILLSPESDSYRILGAKPDATADELRTHMALLMRWLHPDVNPGTVTALHAGRVIQAWDNLKTPERRRAYDASVVNSGSEGLARQRKKPAGHGPRARHRIGQPEGPRGRGQIIQRVLAYFFNR
jgi:DnaJ domain